MTSQPTQEAQARSLEKPMSATTMLKAGGDGETALMLEFQENKRAMWPR